MKAGWKKVLLGDAFKTVTGNTPPKNVADFYGESVPLVKPPELCDGKIDSAEDGLSDAGANVARIAPPNSILVSCIGNLGKVGMNIIPVAFNQQINAILPDKNKAIPEFMFYQILSGMFRSQLEDLASGTTVAIVNKSRFNSISIVLPPLPEQKRIVSILDEAFEGIATAVANAERNLINARELFDRTFSQIVNQYDDGSWKALSVKDVAVSKKGAIRTGPFGSQLLHSEFVDSGIAVLGIDNAVENEFKWSRRRYISEEKYKQLSRYRVYPDDVVITIMGTCGRCAVVPEDIPVAINTKHLCCITLDKNKCLPSFLHAYFLHHPIAREYLARQSKGAIMAGLNMEIIKEMPLLLPPLDIQKVVIDRVKAVNEELISLQKSYQKKSSSLTELKKSILNQAFSGQLN